MNHQLYMCPSIRSGIEARKNFIPESFTPQSCFIATLEALGDFIKAIFWLLWDGAGYFSLLFHHWAGTTTQIKLSKRKKGIWSQFWSKIFHTSKFCNISPSIDWIRNSHFSQTPWLNKLQNLPPSPHTPSLNLWLIHYFCIDQHRKAIPGYSTHIHIHHISKFLSLLGVFDNNCESNLNTRQLGGREANHNGQLRGPGAKRWPYKIFHNSAIPVKTSHEIFSTSGLCYMNWQRL